ncbi:MAG: hypothetical protein M5U12_23265 [Verrucomicrobia bacterium]|nr:hypothetical protein [Verrucomicrobiota bacterium]
MWDGEAVRRHPEWAVVKADGQRDDRMTSVFGPYVDQLLIPQLRELAGDYRADGVWVDGECWATVPDYGAAATAAFRAATGIEGIPRKPGEAHWIEWMDFHREAFRKYLRHYLAALKESHPDFEVASNWAFSDHMPEPVSADVAFLSGDFSPQNSLNSARFSARCLQNQGETLGPDVVVLQRAPGSPGATAQVRQTTRTGSRHRPGSGRRLPGVLPAETGRFHL